MSGNISNEIVARRDAQALADKLQKAVSINEKWHMTFEAQVRPGPYNDYEIVVTARVGTKVYNRLLSAVDIEYFNEDQATITRLMAQSFLIELLLDNAVEGLGIVLAPAIENAAALNKHRSKL